MRGVILRLAVLAAAGLSAGLHAQPAQAGEILVYTFKGGIDGANPASGLVNVGGTLYGTTLSGGTSSLQNGENCNSIPSGCGTIFSVTAGGVETVLHSFQGSSDGALPTSGLINIGDALYGATLWGGGFGFSCDYGCGTVFTVSAGKTSLMYSFPNAYMGPEGAFPLGGLLDVNGELYGTTEYGTAAGYGAVFKLSSDGTETVLHSFAGGSDGAAPASSMIKVGNVLYGTTSEGGGSSACSQGCGTVFRVSSQGVVTVLYAFGGAADGAYPYASLINVGGTLYGTTYSGGGTGCGGSGCGTVFKITQTGVETVLHSFQGGSDGANPDAPLTKVGNMLYGTTYYGAGTGCGGQGCGTVFRITAAGNERVLHAFNGANGAFPRAGLIEVGDLLYGTTFGGGVGCGGEGCGVVYAVKPPVPGS